MSRLIVLSPHGSVRQVNIKRPITTIGRDPTCGVHIDSLGVSRHHAAELANIDARARSDWASFFRQGSVARHAELRRHGWRERRS